MKINIHFFIFLVISLIVVVSDILIYILNLNYITSVVIGLIAIIILSIFLIKRKKINITYDFEITDLLLISLVLIKLIICIAIPDNSYDVRMYHIYQQEYPFMDKINFDFFPGRTINVFLYPLGDRIFFLMRTFLGFRLGTIISYYCIIILFYQTKNLIYGILEINKSKLISLLSSLIFFINIIYIFIGTYYVDIFSAVFLMEIICLIFQKEEKSSICENKTKLYLLFIIMGIIVGIKVPNILLVIPFFLYVLIKNINGLKNLKIRDYILCCLLFIMPFFVYMFDNIKQTGSPIFPYYNTVFKSEWFDIINWKDTRWGIPNILYAFIWPIVACIELQKTTDEGLLDLIWGIGYVFLIIYMIVFFVKLLRKTLKLDIINKKIIGIVFLIFISTLIWGIFLNGYMRYAYIIPILYIVILILFINQEIKNINNTIFKIIMIYFILISICMSTFSVVKMYISDINLAIATNWNNSETGKILNDRKIEKIHIDGAWITLADDSMLVTLVREEGTPIYCLDSRFIAGKKATEKQYELKQKNLYTIIDRKNNYRKIHELNVENMQIQENVMENVQFDFLINENTATVYKVKYNANSEEVIKNNNKYLFSNPTF